MDADEILRVRAEVSASEVIGRVEVLEAKIAAAASTACGLLRSPPP